MRAVYDYNDIRFLHEIQQSDMRARFQKGLFLTATSALKNEMKCYYEKEGYRVYGIHEVIRHVFRTLNTRNLRTYTVFRNVMEDHIERNGIRDSADSLYLRRNAGEMLNAIKLLTETGARPEDIPEDELKKGPLAHFQKLWQEYRNTDDVMTRLCKQQEHPDFMGLWRDIPEFRDANGEKPELFLVGFYFITPLQDRFFNLLEKEGYQLNFLNCHSKEDAFITQIWEKTFSEYSDESAKIIQLQEDRISNVFADKVGGRGRSADNIHVVKHHTDFELAQYVKSAIDNGETVYSPDAERCEKILREYYPEQFAKKRLLSYPVGQYIYYLHKMWDSEENALSDMRYEYVFRCFATGWVEVETQEGGQVINGRDHLYQLKILENYFRTCRKSKDWKEQLDLLKSLYKYVEKTEGQKPSRKRIAKDPLRYIGILSLAGTELDLIDKLIIKLFQDAEYLFKEIEGNARGKVILKTHLKKLIELIGKRAEDNRIDQEEKGLINSLISLLKDAEVDGIECPVSGIRDAVLLLVDDRLGDYESREDETEVLDRMVLPLSMVEAGVLSNYGQKAHLVLADETTLPGKAKRLPWPLTDELLDKMQKNKALSRYIRDMRDIIRNRPLSYRYLFYTYMGIPGEDDHAELSIEWICNRGDRDIEMSPYVRLLGIEIKDTHKEETDWEKIFSQEDDHKKERETILELGYSEEDAAICRKRYIYSYLLNEHPSYTDLFHQKFLLSALMAYYRDEQKKVVLIVELFKRFLGQMETDSTWDYFVSSKDNDLWVERYSIKEGKKWNEDEDAKKEFELMRIHFLNQIKMYEMVKGPQDKRTICMYCPYRSICTDGNNANGE